MSESYENYSIKFDHFTEQELEEYITSLDEDELNVCLKALQAYNDSKRKKLDQYIAENKRKKNMCMYYLKELWDSLPEDEKENLIGFFKQQAMEIDRL